MLIKIHRGHWGIVRSKQLARRYCAWPGIDHEIGKMIYSCSACSRNSKLPSKQFTSWTPTTRPFERVHVDFLGPFKNFVWMILIDSFSRFPFIAKMKNISARQTIDALKSIFCLEGYPETLVSDNGRQFVSLEFSDFCTTHGIMHKFSPPYHPESNGLAERFVQSFKSSISKSMDSGSTLEDSVYDYLISYRGTPSIMNKKSFRDVSWSTTSERTRNRCLCFCRR
ncbi:Pro-Pol polyprotein [Thelohanellus kitauei]|uniref:Pro-Pol polyprotein n=1 Tax=Thelohanellus kitauei TaxID=669202 RepID=A0A0C2JXF8_THEKT|nr:Pro-Pol polyprotein [Thelohanellus kitauei]